MQRNIRPSLAAAALAALCLAAPAAYAAGDAAADKPSMITRCTECGEVYSLRRVEKPVAPERDASASPAPAAGGIGNETQAVPLVSFGKGGAQRVPREQAAHSVWEMTVRYDNGQFGLVTLDSQPVFGVGDRVRRVDNTFVPDPRPGR